MNRTQPQRTIGFEIYKPQSRPAYCPGDLLAGLCIVNLDYYTAEEIQRVDISFSGRSEVLLTERATGRPYYDNKRIVFFEQVQTVASFQYPDQPSEGQYMYPFEFTFPAVAVNPQQGPYAPHPAQMRLPPSVYTTVQTAPMYAGGVLNTVGYDGEIRIVYELQARIMGIQGYCKEQQACEIKFMPYAWYPHPKLGLYGIKRPLTVESSALKPYADRGAMHKIFKRVTIQDLPVSKFNLIMELPSHAVWGDNLPLFLGVDYDLDASTATELPEISLVTLDLTYNEHFAVGEEPRFGSQMMPVVVSPKTQSHKVTLRRQMKPIQITERTNISIEIATGELILRDLSFRTTNIRRYYDKLHVTVGIEVAKKFFQVHFAGSRDLFIHPLAPPESAAEVSSEAAIKPPELHSEQRFELHMNHRIDELDTSRVFYEMPT
jgi:hypothetical protein